MNDEEFMEIVAEEELEDGKIQRNSLIELIELLQEEAAERARLEKRVEDLEEHVEFQNTYFNEKITDRVERVEDMAFAQSKENPDSARDPDWSPEKPKTDKRVLKLYNRLLTMHGNGTYRTIKSGQARSILGMGDDRKGVHRVFDRMLELSDDGVLYKNVREKSADESRSGERMVYIDDF